jgi:hypothetical protein
MNWSLMKTDTCFFFPFFFCSASLITLPTCFYACLLACMLTERLVRVLWSGCVCGCVCVCVCVWESGLLGGCCWRLGIWQGPVCACFSCITAHWNTILTKCFLNRSKTNHT